MLQGPDNYESLIKNILDATSPTPSSSHDSDSSPTCYHLPFRHNRGKPPARYSPNIEGKRSKYPISNNVATQRLIEPLKKFNNELSSYLIPVGVHETLNDPKWSREFKEEMKTLQKNKTWKLIPLSVKKKIVGCK